MEVWPPPPTNNADPPPENAPPRRRLVTRYVWLDVVLGVLAGAAVGPLALVICVMITGYVLPDDLTDTQTILCFWIGLCVPVLAFGFLWRVRRAFAGAALAVTGLVWLPAVVVVSWIMSQK